MDRAESVHGFAHMPFDLPRSPRSLRFTGSVRALSAEDEAKAGAAPALGRARPNAPPPSSARAAPMSARPPPPAAPLTTPTRLTTMRGQSPSIGDEEVDTLCLDRDA